MPITVNEQTVIKPDFEPLSNHVQDLTEEELEALEDAEDLAVAKERYATIDRSQLIPAGTSRSVKQEAAPES